jgi:anti-sigma factor ChrR (cupin superfamily)
MSGRDPLDAVDFDDVTLLALAEAASAGVEPPPPRVKASLMARLRGEAPAPHGFRFATANDDTWLPHPVPGIRMKILALNKKQGYVTLLLDAAPGTRFPPHHHGGAEECYVVSGSIYTCGRHLRAGDFVHADENSDHTELWTEEGARVILVVPPEEHLPAELLA